MDNSIVYVILTLLGLCLGSFAGAQVWRLRARQLIADKAAGEPVDKAELKRLKNLGNVKTSDDRSRCLHCGHQLAWYDMIPLVSWLSLGGKCRYCRKRIGMMEPAMELGLAAFFVLSFAFWPFELTGAVEIASLVLWLLAGVGLLIVLAYDAKWFLIPYQAMLPVILIALISASLTIWQAPDKLAQFGNVLAAVAILAGLYWLLARVSQQTWVGYGDSQVGLALALLLADWRLAFLTLFAANLIGFLIVAPGLASGRLNRKSPVPFGPLLIAGFFITGLWGHNIVGWYTQLLL